MKRYKLIEVGSFAGDVIGIKSTDSEVVQSLIHDLEEIDLKFRIRSHPLNDEFYSDYTLDRFKVWGSAKAGSWIINWLCEHGWEPIEFSLPSYAKLKLLVED